MEFSKHVYEVASYWFSGSWWKSTGIIHVGLFCIGVRVFFFFFFFFLFLTWGHWVSLGFPGFSHCHPNNPFVPQWYKWVYECNGINIFMRWTWWKTKCYIQQGEAEFNGTFHLSPNENICSIAQKQKQKQKKKKKKKNSPCLYLNKISTVTPPPILAPIYRIKLSALWHVRLRKKVQAFAGFYFPQIDNQITKHTKVKPRLAPFMDTGVVSKFEKHTQTHPHTHPPHTPTQHNTPQQNKNPQFIAWEKAKCNQIPLVLRRNASKYSFRCMRRAGT